MELQTPPDAVVTWLAPVGSIAIQCSTRLLEELTELATSGFRRYPWGGVEIGGFLLGRHEPGQTLILALRAFDCAHEYGPAFELTARDVDRFGSVIENAVSGENPKGLVAVGWFHTVSRQELALSDHDRRVHKRLFPEPRHVLLVMRRSKTDPLEIGFFRGNAGSDPQLHSPVEQLTAEFFGRAEPLDGKRETLSQAPAAAAETVQIPEQLPLPELLPLSDTEVPKAQPAAVPAPASMDLPPETLENRYAFLGLLQCPFSPVPDVRFLCPFPQYRKALASLVHRVQSRAGFVSLIGAPGVGKSLVLEYLIGELKTRSVAFAFLTNSKIGAEEFFDLLAHDLDLACLQTNKASVLIALNEYLISRLAAGQTTALIVDNAHKLSVNVLEEIELLGNLENRDGHLLQVVFAAQPSFERILQSPELRGLHQRLSARVRLSPLEAAQTADYIIGRLEKAGLASQAIFSADLLSDIHTRTQGIPRLINAVCNGLLDLCIEQQCRVADTEMVERVASDLSLDSLLDPDDDE